MRSFVLFTTLLIPHLTFAQYQPKSSNHIIRHSYYTLSYSEINKEPEWVYYLLCPSIITGKAERKNHFKPDPLISSGSASLEDYKGSGYDRGHMCPAGSMLCTQEANDESFFLDNMCPQLHSCNAGRWKSAESYMRNWAGKDSIYVVSGPVLKNPLGFIGPNKVTIPAEFFKIGYCPARNKMIAFIIPNKKCENDLSHYIVTVDNVESITGIDFYPELPDEIENNLESKKGEL